MIAAAVGAFSGLIGAAFHYLIEKANSGRILLRIELTGGDFPGWLVFAVMGGLAVSLALLLVRRLAPEAGGSGVPEIEGALAGLRELRWRRVLPVKFFGGLLAIGAGLALGREGPTIHMGGAIGRMLADCFRISREHTKALVTAGAGAGLAAAFNAPLAGIVFVTEEMREEFDYNFVSLQAVILACCGAVVVSDWWLGQGPVMPISNLALPPLGELPLFLLLGILVGCIGVVFNKMLLGAVDIGARLRSTHAAATAFAVGAATGLLAWFLPDTVGAGERLVDNALSQHWGELLLLALLAARLLTTVASFGTGVPGGIFAPLLALGTLAGIAFGALAHAVLGKIVSPPGVFAVASMGALFAATVRAPLTGIVLIVELTGAYGIGLTIILTCLSATFTAEALGSRPVYRLLLERRLQTRNCAQETRMERKQ